MTPGGPQLLLLVFLFAVHVAAKHPLVVDTTVHGGGMVHVPKQDGKLKSGKSGYDCADKVFTDELSGYVYSPLYPASYPNSSDCLYIISVPEGSTVLLTLYALKTEPCCDKLDIYDGDGGGKLIKSLSNRLDPGASAVFQSTGRFITLNFTSDLQIDDHGFYARFDATPADDSLNPSKSSDCPSANQFFGSWGVLVSPTWPYHYPNMMDCYYHIDVVRGKKIELRVNYFNTETGADVVMVYDDGLGGETSPLLKNMSGRYDDGSFSLMSSGSAMTLRFISDPQITYDGFSFTYTAV